MTSSINLNSNQFYLLQNDIRISSTSTFSAQNAYEQAFEDVAQDVAREENNKIEENNRINYYNLGAPADFILNSFYIEEIENSQLTT